MGKKCVLNRQRFHKNYDEDGDIGYFFEVDIEYPRELHDLHSDLPFLQEKMEINMYTTSLYAICMIKKLCCPCKITKTIMV